MLVEIGAVALAFLGGLLLRRSKKFVDIRLRPNADKTGPRENAVTWTVTITLPNGEAKKYVVAHIDELPEEYRSMVREQEEVWLERTNRFLRRTT
jgi:hypothetical protein